MNQTELGFYRVLLGEIKARVRQGQRRAALSANAEMISMYWDIGRMIAARQEREGWGAAVIPRLSVDLKNELPEEKGFSERNIGRMIAFYRAYQILPQPVAKLPAHPVGESNAPDSDAVKVPPPVAQLPEPAMLPILQRSVAQIPWGHNIFIHKPIGVADYELTRALPTEFASSLPSIEEIEAELSQSLKVDGE